MKFESTKIDGVVEISSERHGDERGYFARIYCQREFTEAGLTAPMVQDSLSHNVKRATLRGMHLHTPGFAQYRLIRCVRGEAFVVVLDLRLGSGTCLQHQTFLTTADNGKAYYTPPGVALGYQTLRDDSTMLYQMPEYYSPEFECGVRWNDPVFGIDWPILPPVILERDATYPDFHESMLHPRTKSPL